MPKYFLNNSVFKKDGKICVTGGAAHHLLHVLRYKLGQPAVFCDGNGTDIHCIYEEHDYKKSNLFFRIKNEIKCFNELPYNVTLYQSVITANKMEFAIQKTVELGVSRIIPVFTKYSSIKVTGIGEKSERYQKIAENSAEQSMRGYIPEVMPFTKFDSVIVKEKKEALWLVAYENEHTTTISQAINSLGTIDIPSHAINNHQFDESLQAGSVYARSSHACKQYSPPLSIGIWIGPEGGFADEEIVLLTEFNAVPVTLGRRILRAETAGMAALIQLQCALRAEMF